jgi:transposase-like protein
MRKYLTDLEFYRVKIGERLTSLSQNLIEQDLEFQRKKPILNKHIETHIENYHEFLRNYISQVREGIKKENTREGLLKFDNTLIQGFKITTLQDMGIN